MRRAFASLLVAIFGFLAVAPGMLAGDASDLPACCRRFGKHHCSLLKYEADGPAVKGVCSNYQTPRPVAVSQGNTGVSAASQADFAPLPAYAAALAQPLSLLQSSPESSHPKRGPPALLS